MNYQKSCHLVIIAFHIICIFFIAWFLSVVDDPARTTPPKVLAAVLTISIGVHIYYFKNPIK